LLPDAQIAPQNPISPPARQLLAPWWHTALLVALLLLASLNGTRNKHAMAEVNRALQYAWTMLWEWVLVGMVWLGTRKRIRLRELIGGHWATLEDFFLDVVFAGAFWVMAMFVLGSVAWLMHLSEPGKFESLRRQIGFLVPRSNLELALWFAVSTTAGFCEEIIFRGYLQRQFALIANSTLAGVALSAIVFGASHGYEGVSRMILIAIFGLMFGLLAWWRKSLRAGMMAHAWHDALSGAILRMMK
jgi:uncharacterized protein